ncbi:hypothetical protein GUJ93_ZPchr0010g11097 [Zizania palustris]|uniref:Bifunctional inhibitor/plant lipid transfer protein/seed storage helical domain-containing protein n=1 Tax=Zizania palustris TaxID=103762 RepID=A0A8J5WAZ9_ZIZPA|nr:hypothetical protein GUJ93_ZPchr0010g11097 [Zizania palustris]
MANKVVFFAALLVAVVVSVAQAAQLGVDDGDEMMRFRDRQCLHEVQEKPLDACRQVLDMQLTGRERLHQPIVRQGAIMELRSQCCQQLQSVSRECRCAAVRKMVRDYEESMSMPRSSSEQQAGQSYYGEGSEQQQQQQQPEHGEQQQPPRMTRVTLTKAKQYATQLPSMCRIEPQQCNVFAAGQN